jgi:hypothetical protein
MLIEDKSSSTGSIIFTDTDHGMPGSGLLAMKKVAAIYRRSSRQAQLLL